MNFELPKPLAEMTLKEFTTLELRRSPIYEASNAIASRVHKKALSAAIKRKRPYVELMKDQGYTSEMHARPTDHGTEWYQILIIGGELIFKTVFLQYDSGPGECPKLAEGCRFATEEQKLMRCKFRWADLQPCPEDEDRALLDSQPG